MILTHEQAILKAQEQLQDLITFVRFASEHGLRIDQAERGLFSRLLELGLSLLTSFVAAAGNGDEGDTTQAPDGTAYRRLPQPHARTYRSIFGVLSITRYVYGTREGQALGWIPLDARLGLPAGDFSYVLEDWAQRLGVQGAFREVVHSLHDLLGLKPSVRSLEHMNRTLGSFAAAFADQRPVPAPSDEGPLVVVTADGKGVPMRQATDTASAPVHTDDGKPGRKRMACVGAVYTIDRYPRTADDVLDEVARRQRAADRPVPRHKHVWAEMTRVIEGEVCQGRPCLFGRLAQEVAARNPGGRKETICLLDGERALWDERQVWFAQAVGILDLFHVLQRLWDAAHCFHAEKSREAEAFVSDRLRLLLEGKVGYVIGGLRQMRTKHRLSGAQRKTLTAVITYYSNNRDHMRYDEYLAAGYPIGSGVAEGACRHLVKDRLEQTGMRWTVEGAQAMLHVRATYLNGDWEAFLEYRVRQEQEQLYGQQAEEPILVLAV
jgi:hypothetical protein